MLHPARFSLQSLVRPTYVPWLVQAPTVLAATLSIYQDAVPYPWTWLLLCDAFCYERSFFEANPSNN
jgi:hypothetical protein